jgi:hypothetical protein
MKVVLYKKSGKKPEIVGCLSHIIKHWEDRIVSKFSSFHPFIIIPRHTSHNHTSYSFQSLVSNSPHYIFYTANCTYPCIPPTVSESSRT